MTYSGQDIQTYFRGDFLTDTDTLYQKLRMVKAYLFDWDGVFNDGEKKENGSSGFSEVEAMGTNLIRLNHYLSKGSVPVTIIVSGEQNEYSKSLARREHFDAVYFKVKHKQMALEHICEQYGLQTEEIAFFFDDVLDLSLASQVGLRLMIGRGANPLLLAYARENRLADYITFHDGGRHGLRESLDLLMGVSGRYDQTLQNRIQFTPEYRSYLTARNHTKTQWFTADHYNKIVTA